MKVQTARNEFSGPDHRSAVVASGNIDTVLVLDADTASALWALLGTLPEVPQNILAPNHRETLEALYDRCLV